MPAPQRVGFVSLGCPKALVDSERILTQLRTEGYEVVPSYDTADLVVVNTCGFIDSAVEESLEAIGEACGVSAKAIGAAKDAALPAIFLHHDHLPLTANGKTDVQSLRAMAQEALAAPDTDRSTPSRGALPATGRPHSAVKAGGRL